MDRARQAEAAGRRVAVRGVADQEDAADAERGGHHGVDRPARDLVDRHRHVAQAERRAHVRLDLLVGLRPRIVDRVVEVDHPLLGVGPPALGPHRHHHDQRRRSGREDPADQHVGVARPAREVGADVQRRRLARRRRGPRTRRRSGRRTRRPPSAPIRYSQRTEYSSPVPLSRTTRGDALVVLLEREQLVVEADAARRELLGARLQDRLEADLRQVVLAPGARRAPVLVVAARAPGLELAIRRP